VVKMGNEDALLGLILIAIGAKIVNNVLEDNPRKKRKKSKGLTFD